MTKAKQAATDWWATYFDQQYLLEYEPIFQLTQDRREVARLVEDLTASHQGGWYSLISLHGGGSPEAMKREIWRNYPVGEKVELVEKLLDRGLVADGRRVSKQPDRCCATGCEVPSLPEAAE